MTRLIEESHRIMLTWLNEKFGEDSSESDSSGTEDDSEMKGLLMKRKNAVERYIKLCKL